MLIKKGKSVVLAVALLLGFTQVAFGKLKFVGPVIPDNNPGAGWSADYNGYPTWYRDVFGQTAGLEVPPDPGTIFDPPDLNNPFSAHTGFGAEAFWWSADASIALGGGNRALLNLALEAAYNTADPTDGEQIAFTRIRIRVDTPVAGTYRITHPYGEKIFKNVPAGTKEINDTADVGIGAPGDFSLALVGQVGPFLKAVAPAPPPGFFGDAATPSTVTGSPTGNNLFRVERETTPGTFVLVGQTNKFVVSGKFFTGTAFVPNLATYAQDATGATTVFATGRKFPPNLPEERITIAANAGAGNFSLTRSGNLYFASQSLGIGVEPPARMRFIGRTNGAQQTILTKEITDVVTVRKADWSATTQTLTVIVDSSDRFAPLPTLTVKGEGISDTVVVGRTGVVTGVRVPPPTITVTSSQGGEDSAPITILP